MLGQRKNLNGKPVTEPATVQRGLPVQAPPQMLAQIQQLKRRCMLLIGIIAGVLLLSIAAFVFLRARPVVEVADKKDEPRPPVRDIKPATEKMPSIKALPDLRGSASAKKLALPLPTPLPEIKSKEPYLETIGGLSAVHLYQSYLNIGLLADAVENETYTRAEAVNVMLTVMELVNMVEKQLGKLPAKGLTSEDEAALDAIQALTRDLRAQSSSLVSYWASGEAAHATRYQSAREQSWNALKEMMGLEE